MFTYVTSDMQRSVAYGWFLHLGFMTVPEHWYASANEPEETAYKNPKVRPSRGGEPFDWDSIRRSVERMEKVISIILRGGGRITANDAYQYIVHRNIKLLAKNVQQKRMSEKRFFFYFHKVRRSMGVKDAREYKIDFVKENHLVFSPSEIAIYLGTKEEYVKQIMRRLKIK